MRSRLLTIRRRIMPNPISLFRSQSRETELPPPVADFKGTLNDYGAYFLQTGNLDGAEKMLLAGLALNKNDFLLNYNLGAVYAKKKDHEQAFQFFKTAHVLNPDHQTAKSNYLIALYHVIMLETEKGDYEKAHQYLDEIKEHEYYAAFAIMQKARVFEKQGNKEAAKNLRDIAAGLNKNLSAEQIAADVSERKPEM